MADRSPIEWLLGADGTQGATWNMIRARHRTTGKVGWHCEKVSLECAHCYAEPINEKRFGTGLPYKRGHRDHVEIFLDERALLKPLSWTARHVFPCSMSDLFGEWVTDPWIDRVVAVMALTPHTYHPLTKRSARMLTYFTGAWRARVAYVVGTMAATGYVTKEHGTAVAQALTDCDALPNVWLGVSAGLQREADERVPHLMRTPAAVRVVSAEPLLEPIHFGYLGWPSGDARPRDGLNGLVGFRYENGRVVERLPRLDQIIVGKESGPHARWIDDDAVRFIRDQCVSAGTAFFYKQDARNGRKLPTPELDGRRWVEMPEARAS